MNKLRPWSKWINPQDLRKTIVEMAMAGGSVHLGSAFSIVEIVATLYQYFVRLNPDDRDDPDRDIIALSKGHGVMALYSVFRELAWVSDAEIMGYFSTTNRLKGLSSVHVPGIEVSGGSLGHGLAVATGMALAARLRRQDRRVFVLVGDGEMNEGSIWEALLFAGHHKLTNLVVIVDANGYQAMGETNTVLNLESLVDKFRAFNFETVETDGHNLALLKRTFDSLIDNGDTRPKAVIARTIKGKGVSFMEGDNNWHYLRLNSVTFAAALKELEQ